MNDHLTVREGVARERVRRVAGFKQLCLASPDEVLENLTANEIENINRGLILVTGMKCVGKSTIVRELVKKGFWTQIPEVMSGRELRSGEVVGEEILPVSDLDFAEKISYSDEMLLAYADSGRCKLCGISFEALRMVARAPGFSAIIVHALAIPWILAVFDCPVFMITANIEDRIRFQLARGMDPMDSDGQNETGAMVDDLSIPGSYVDNVIVNRFGHLEEVADELHEKIIFEQFLRRNILALAGGW